MSYRKFRFQESLFSSIGWTFLFRNLIFPPLKQFSASVVRELELRFSRR